MRGKLKAFRKRFTTPGPGNYRLSDALNKEGKYPLSKYKNVNVKIMPPKQF